jgi:hypothetical protein
VSSRRSRIRTTPLEKRLAAHIAAGLMTAPIERFAHGQDLAAPTMTRAAHRIGNVVETLYDAHTIGDPEMVAADRFRRDHGLGLLSSHEDTCRGGSGPESLHVVMLARCHALDAHAALAELLGLEMMALAISAIVDDLSFREMDRRSGRAGDHRKELAGAVVALLKFLPGAYRSVDLVHRRVVQQPVRPVRIIRRAA